jgi:multimeric flavodoxin WrbA
MACFSCANGQGCAHADGDFRARTNAMYAADGILIGSPVYYSAISGTLKSFLDRAFFSSKGRLRHKIAASVAVARRAGAVSTFDQINHYFLISEMVIAPAQYWNVARGLAVGDVLSDAEGISIFRNLGKNMAWLLKMREAASAIRPPEAE